MANDNSHNHKHKKRVSNQDESHTLPLKKRRLSPNEAITNSQHSPSSERSNSTIAIKKEKISDSPVRSRSDGPIMPPALENTADALGENEDKGAWTLKSWLEREELSSLYPKLQQMRMNKIQTFVHLREGELDELCQATELSLSFMQQLKFKTAVRALQQEYVPKPVQRVVTTCKEEEDALNEIERVSKQMEDIQHLFEAHFNRIQANVDFVKTSIDEEFKRIFERLGRRKNAMHKQTEEWKVEKLAAVREEIRVIADKEKKLRCAMTKCDELLTQNGANRAVRMIESIQATLKEHSIKQPLKEYIEQHSQLMTVAFDEQNSCIANLGQFGSFTLAADPQIAPTIPSKLKLLRLQKRNDIDRDDHHQNVNGFFVTLQWSVVNKSESHDSLLVIQRRVITNGDDDDDDRKQKSKHDEWQRVQYSNIDNSELEQNESVCSAYIECVHEYGVEYEYLLQLHTAKPIEMCISSNTLTFFVGKIPLNIDSHRKHWYNNDSFHPRNLLKADGSYYSSAHNRDFVRGESDWMVFSYECLWLPLKITIRNDGGVQGVSVMSVWLGDGEKEWKRFEPQTINVEKKGEEKEQSFSVSGIREALIAKKRWKYIKIKLIKNHGFDDPYRCRFAFYEFSVFGKRL